MSTVGTRFSGVVRFSTISVVVVPCSATLCPSSFFAFSREGLASALPVLFLPGVYDWLHESGRRCITSADNNIRQGLARQYTYRWFDPWRFYPVLTRFFDWIGRSFVVCTVWEPQSSETAIIVYISFVPSGGIGSEIL